MTDKIKQPVDANSAEIKDGVALNSEFAIRTWVLEESTTPLFMRYTSETNNDNLQDEKDETEE